VPLSPLGPWLEYSSADQVLVPFPTLKIYPLSLLNATSPFFRTGLEEDHSASVFTASWCLTFSVLVANFYLPPFRQSLGASGREPQGFPPKFTAHILLSCGLCLEVTVENQSIAACNLKLCSIQSGNLQVYVCSTIEVNSRCSSTTRNLEGSVVCQLSSLSCGFNGAAAGQESRVILQFTYLSRHIDVNCTTSIGSNGLTVYLNLDNYVALSIA